MEKSNKRIFKFVFLLLLAFLSIIAVGCGNKSNGSDYPNDDENGETNEETNRKIYYNVNYTIKNRHIDKTIATIGQKVKEYNGYIDNSYEKDNYANYVYRIPSDKLNDFMNYMSTIGSVIDKSFSSNDITIKYSYTTERLNTLYASKEAYLVLLTREGLTMDEIISIKSKIEEIDTEIRTLERTKADYDNLLDYSTVTIVYRTSNKIKASFLKDYVQYLRDFVVGLFKFIMYALPFGIVGGGVAILIYFLQEKSRKKRIAERQQRFINNSNNNSNSNENKK